SAKNIDGVAILAGATSPCRDVVDGVVGDEAAIVALAALPDTNAAIAAAADRVGRNNDAAAVVAKHSVIVRARDRIAGDVTSAAHERDAGAAGAIDAAVSNTNGLCCNEVHETTILRQRLTSAVEYKSRQRDAVAFFRRQERRPAREDNAGRTTRTNKLG